MATANLDLLRDLSAASRKAVLPHLGNEIEAASLEDFVATLNFILTRLDVNCERWSQAITMGKTSFDWTTSRDFSVLYRDWLAVATSLMEVLVRIDPDQCPDQFRENIQRVKLMSLDTDRTKHSIESLQNNTGIPFEHAMESLRNSLR